MENYNLIKIIALIAIFIALLLSFFLFTVRTKNKLANSLLAIFIILCAVDISGFFISYYPNLLWFSKTFTLLIFPSFFLYVSSISYTNFRLNIKHSLHTIPFIIYSLILIIYFFNERNDYKLFYIQKIEWIFNVVLLKIQALFYIIGIFITLKKHKKIYLENFASGNISIYKWLYKITFLFILTLPITVVKDFIFLSKFYYILTWTNIVLVSIALLMLCLFVLKALYSPELFRGVNSKLQTAEQLEKRKTNKIIETGKSINIDAQIQNLKEYMFEKEPYLEPKLNLQDLASRVNIDSRELSILINQHIGQHFFDFINEYRIEKAMKNLRSFPKNELTIQQVFFDVGFNSKSSFNTAFKKHTGLTPTAYRNETCKSKLYL